MAKVFGKSKKYNKIICQTLKGNFMRNSNSSNVRWL